MSEPAAPPTLPRWLAAAVIALLATQVGLLWLHGAMLERQHGELQGLRQDVQDLSENLEDFEGNFDQGASDPTVRPSRYRPRKHRRPAAVRVRIEEPEGKARRGEDDTDQAVRKELDNQRQSEREAVAKAREVQSKLSWEDNARKASEKARLDAPNHPPRRWLWYGSGAALLVLFMRSWLRKRG